MPHITLTYIYSLFFSFFFKDCHVNPLPKIIFYFFKDRKVIHFGLLSVDKYKYLLKITHMTYKLKLEICWIKERNGMLCCMALSLFSSLFSFSLDTTTHTQAFFFVEFTTLLLLSPLLFPFLLLLCILTNFSSLIPLSSPPLSLLLFPSSSFPPPLSLLSYNRMDEHMETNEKWLGREVARINGGCFGELALFEG